MGWMIVLYNCTLPDDGRVSPETYGSLHIETLS